MEHIPSWQASSSSAILEIPLLYGTQTKHCVYGNLMLVPACRKKTDAIHNNLFL